MRLLQRSIRIALGTVTLLSTACTAVYTIDDVVTESAAITDDRLIGEWHEIEGKDVAYIARGEGKNYAVRYLDSEDTARFTVRLGRLGSVMVVDAYPDAGEWAARKELGIPQHIVLTVEFNGDSLGLRAMKGDSIAKAIDAGVLRVPYSKVTGGDLLLHGDQSNMRMAVAQIVRTPRLLEDIAWFRLSRREGRQPSP